MLAVLPGLSRNGRRAALGLCGAGLIAGAASLGLAQGLSEQQVRCLQLQQELAAVQGGGGANREELMRIEQEIAQVDRVFQGTRAAMEDAGCFESFFIFGRGLVRSPKCLNMNNRLEDARRELTQLQQQRQALRGGGGNKRRQAELQQALARSGCGGVRAPQPRRGGLFDFFTGGRDDEVEELPQTPIYRSIDPNGRYRTVCVRLCDGFYFPISYSTYGSRVAQDAERCQATCAAPAELYVYRNPGQDIEQAVSLSGSAYMDLPVALRYRKEYVKGCSCKQAEYNPTAIEAANKRAEADPAAPSADAAAPASDAEATAAVPPQESPAEEPPAQMAVPAEAPQFDLDITGSNESAPPAEAAAEASPPAALPEEQEPPAPAEAAAPPPAPPPTAQAAPPPPPDPAAPPAQSTVTKRKPSQAQPSSPFTPQF
jgi:hypothetical protein